MGETTLVHFKGKILRISMDEKKVFKNASITISKSSEPYTLSS
jgi:hypothetical protein